MNRHSLRRRIVGPLGIALGAMLASFVALFYVSQRRNIDESRTRDQVSVERYFSSKLDSDGDLMAAALDGLSRNPHLRQAFESGDRDALREAAQAAFTDLKTRHHITHMYFLDTSRVVRLRMHRPEQFGDTIPRLTMTQAVRTGKLAHGLELGRLRALLTLRTVMPWYDGDRLIGYVELGEEIEHIAQEVKRVLGVDLFVSIRKELVDRASWEAGMRQFGREPNWERFPSDLLVHHTIAVPPELTRHFATGAADRDQFVDVKLGGKRLMGSALPLRDIADSHIGEIVFLRDYTALAQGTFRTFLVSALLAVLVGLACMILLYERVRHFFIGPLLELRSVAERAGKGELSLVAAEHRPDELGDLAASINRMILDLRSAQAEQTRLVLDAALDAVATFDQHGQVIDWNRQAEALFGWSRGDAIGKSVFDLMRRSSTRPAIEKALENYRDSGTSGLFNRLLEETVQRRDGSVIVVEMAIAPVRASSGLFFSAFIRDISDRKRLEEDLQAAQRLEAIGKLAGGIAHDFNNLITAIVGYVTSVQEALIPGTQPYDDANEIHRAADRATGLVQQLLAFARKRVVQPRIVAVNDLVMRTDRMLRRLIGEHIQLEITLDRGLWPVLADPGQLEQVLVNLAVNARDAMPGTGRVQIQTANVVISGALSVDGAVPPGYYVMFAVSDTGAGMDDATLAHIFEPFFTTKPQGQGTGLGLATCYGIVKQAGGYVRVSSTKGRGSIFRIYLPRAEAAPRPEPVVVRRVAGVNRNETILLVEDEHQVRRLIERALKQQGYTIIAANNGAEAIRASRDYAEPIHLLLTDVVMPEMGGREAAAIIRAERGDIRVIYMSGYSEELVRLQGELTESAAFIAKPFAPDELRRVIRDVLDAVPA